MAAERKSLNSIHENGKDAILSEDLLGELGTTRRSVRQQAIKLQEKELQQQQHEWSVEGNTNSLPAENMSAAMETDNKEPAKEPVPATNEDSASPATPQRRGRSLNKEPTEPVKDKESLPTEPVKEPLPKEPLPSNDDDSASPATPQKRGPGRPRKHKKSTRPADSSSERKKRDSSSEKHAGSGVTDSESEDASIKSSKSPERPLPSKGETLKSSASSKADVSKSGSKANRKGVSERSVRMSPLKNIPAAQREAVSGLVAKAATNVKQKLELSNKDTAKEHKDSKSTSSDESKHTDSAENKAQKVDRRKRKRDESESKDGDKTDEEVEKRTLRRRKVKDDGQQSDAAADSEKEESSKLNSKQKETKKSEKPGKDDEVKKDEEPKKDEAPKKDGESKKKVEEPKKKVEELKKKIEELEKKDEELQKKDEELQKKDEELQKKDEELQKKSEKLEKKHEEVKKKDEPEKVETPKRKRGRPRKNPLPPEKDDTEKDSAAPKDSTSAEDKKNSDTVAVQEKAVTGSKESEQEKAPISATAKDDKSKKMTESGSKDKNGQSKVQKSREAEKIEEISTEEVTSEKPLPVADKEAEADSEKVAKMDESPDQKDITSTNTQDKVENSTPQAAKKAEKTEEKDEVVNNDKVPSESTDTNGVTQETNDSTTKIDKPTDSIKESKEQSDAPQAMETEASDAAPVETTGTDNEKPSQSVDNVQGESSTKTPVVASADNTEDMDSSEPMDATPQTTVAAAPIPPVSGADAAANALPSNSPQAEFPVGTAGSVTPQKAAAEDGDRKVRKPKSRPRNSMGRTHFGQTRKRRSVKRNNYDSDSTDVQSECSNEGHPTGKKYKRSNSTSTHTSMESEDDRSSHSSVNKGRSTIPALPDALSAQAEPPLCSCKMEWDKPSSSNITVCNAHEVINNKLVECGMSVDGLKVLRPSSRVGFKTLCEEHRHKMAKHQCCPGCGCFCSAGIMMMCTVEEVNHHFHKECIKEIDGTLYCPHCGENASLAKEVTLPSTEALDQLKIVPQSILLNGAFKLPRVLLARITGMTSKALALHMGEEEDIQIPRARMQAPISRKGIAPFLPLDDVPDDLPSKSITLKSGITISSASLPPGPSRDALETALQFLDTESPKRLRFFPKNLYLSTSQGDLDKVLQMLGDGFDPNYRFPSHNHETALHVAAAKGHLEIMSMLIQAGANVDPVDEDHRTPMHVATENNQVLCMKYLVKHGANPQHLDDDGMSILHAAAKIGSLEAIQFILSLRKVSINVQDDGGWSPVIWAAESRNIPIVSYLLQRGADPNTRDKEGNTALHWASFAGSDELTELFLSRGCDVTAVNIHGDTPLHISARENYYAVVNMLLLRNADISIRNKENETPSDCTEPKSDIYLALQVNKQMKYAVAKRAIKTEKIISRDISRGMEVHPIPVVNAVDEEGVPDDFLYVSESCETSRLNIDRNIKHMQGCLCTDDCALETCTCARSSVQCWYDSDSHLLPEFNFHEPPMIFECGRACYCWRNCRNRVVQNGIKTHLVLFRTPKMGWGVRTTQDIKQGTFICEYAGELISDADADIREDDSYLFDLDNREGDVYCIDARFYGNISRFINHLCEPNIVPVRVFIDHHDLRFPRIAFFTSRDVRANEELGFDYGDKFWAIKSKFFTCCCGSRLCKHMQPTPDLFSETNHAGVQI